MPIPYGRQCISSADINAVVEVLKSDFLTQGEAVPLFEKAVAQQCGAEFAVAVNSATSALHLACLALNLGPDDWVWTSPISFVASANCARYCGANVDFVDIDPQTYNMSVAHLQLKLEQAEKLGNLPKIVIPVHLSGQVCEMKAIHDLGQKYGFNIIEDASHAIGGKYQQQPVGNCQFSDITVFSFHPVKIITTGEGGMALTQDAQLYQRMMRLRSHGIVRNQEEMTHPPDGGWYYQQLELGYNYRLTDIQAALGLSQLQNLEAFVSRRHSLAQRYNQHLAKLPLRTPWQHPDSYSGQHLYIVRLNLDQVSVSHRAVYETLKAAGIGVNIHYIPIYSHPYYAQMGFQPTDFPESEQYYQEALTLPLFPTLTESEQDEVISQLRKVLIR
ncbi:MAG: UDP-4-amino-4,6-dideoxy-N-acetyl-beta-L-altrosamine transaminase [Candidatus Sericytochromatia bacterium]